MTTNPNRAYWNALLLCLAALMRRSGWNLRVVLAVCLVVLLTRLPARAQGQGSTSLDVGIELVSSISLVFDTSSGGCPLANSGTNSVGLNLGWANNTGGHLSCATYTCTGNPCTRYTLTTPFGLDVEVTNSTSTQYGLRVWISTANITGVTYRLGTHTLPYARPGTATQTNSYGLFQESLQVRVNNTVAARVLSFTVQFEATAL